MSEQKGWNLYSVCYKAPLSVDPEHLLVIAPSEEAAIKRAIVKLINGETPHKNVTIKNFDNSNDFSGIDVRVAKLIDKVDGYEIVAKATEEAQTGIPDIDLMKLKISWRYRNLGLNEEERRLPRLGGGRIG